VAGRAERGLGAADHPLLPNRHLRQLGTGTPPLDHTIPSDPAVSCSGRRLTLVFPEHADCGWVLPMLHARQKLSFGRGIAGQFVGDDHAQHVFQTLEQLAEEAFGRLLVASTPH